MTYTPDDYRTRFQLEFALEIASSMLESPTVSPSNNCLAKSRHSVSLPRCRALHHPILTVKLYPRLQSIIVYVALSSEKAQNKNAAQMPDATQHRCKALGNTPSR